MSELPKTNKYQQVEITLEDGRVGYFVGPELVAEEKGKIQRVRFFPSEDLPEGHKWSFLKDPS